MFLLSLCNVGCYFGVWFVGSEVIVCWYCLVIVVVCNCRVDGIGVFGCMWCYGVIVYSVRLVVNVVFIGNYLC